MPHFQWTGLDLEGNSCKGTLECASLQALQEVLVQQEIALISARLQKESSRRSWSYDDTLSLLSQLHELLQAGLFLPDALTMIAQHEPVTKRKTVTTRLEQQISAGVSFSNALEEMRLFDPMTITLITAGQETGNLTTALEVLVRHITFQQTFRKRIRSALTMPALSLGFFLLVCCFVVFGLLPNIANLFTQQQCTLPRATQYLLSIHTHAWVYAIAGLTVVLGLITAAWSLRGTLKWHHILATTPGLRYWAHQRALVSFFKTLALVTQGNITLVTALSLAQQSVSNLWLKEELNAPIEAIGKGASVSQAIGLIPWAQHAVPLLAVGEQTGNLSSAIARTAIWYEQRFTSSLEQIALYLPPVLLVIMGFGIAGLICAVYMPIISLAGAIKL
jgi:type II secretory pathway component PulF